MEKSFWRKTIDYCFFVLTLVFSAWNWPFKSVFSLIKIWALGPYIIILEIKAVCSTLYLNIHTPQCTLCFWSCSFYFRRYYLSSRETIGWMVAGGAEWCGRNISFNLCSRRSQVMAPELNSHPKFRNWSKYLDICYLRKWSQP